MKLYIASYLYCHNYARGAWMYFASLLVVPAPQPACRLFSVFVPLTLTNFQPVHLLALQNYNAVSAFSCQLKYVEVSTKLLKQ